VPETWSAYATTRTVCRAARTYLRTLGDRSKIGPAEVTAQVMGSSLYRITVSVREVAVAHWQRLHATAPSSIDTLVELLQGQLSTSVMERITRREPALPVTEGDCFQLQLSGFGAMCKHVQRRSTESAPGSMWNRNFCSLAKRRRPKN